jgi:AraC-like DNA-binding protein
LLIDDWMLMSSSALPGIRASTIEHHASVIQSENIERQVTQLLWSAASYLPNKKIAYKYAQYDALDMLRMLDYVLVAQNNLFEGINVWARLLPLLDVPVAVKATRDEHYLLLSFSGCETCPPWLYFVLCALHARLLAQVEYPCWYLDPGVGRISLPLPCQLKPGLPILRQQKGVCLTLPRDILLRNYIFPAPAISDVVVQFLDWLTPESFGKFGAVDAIKHQLGSLLPRVPSIGELAEHLCISARTLQRRLKQQAYSYSQLTDEVRHTEALRLLATSAKRLTDVAQDLGFSEASSFQRAFTRWQGCSPSQYRRQLRMEPNHQDSEPPIQLYYAENRMRDQKLILRRTARVWLLIGNLGFEKEVRVRCLDMDGLYREYEAHFECFVSPQLELWSTANLPVAEPLHFMMSMRVGGRHYMDDNQGAGYRLYHQDEVLMGRHSFVHPQSYLHYSSSNKWNLYGVIYTSLDEVGDLYIVDDVRGEENKVSPVARSGGRVKVWHFEIPVKDVGHRYSILLKHGGLVIYEDGPFTATFI